MDVIIIIVIRVIHGNPINQSFVHRKVNAIACDFPDENTFIANYYQVMPTWIPKGKIQAISY